MTYLAKSKALVTEYRMNLFILCESSIGDA